MMLFTGLIYAWSIFASPLEKEFGWDRGQTSLVFTISMSVSILGQIFGGFLVSRRRQGLALRLASLFLLVGFVKASRVTSLAGLYVAYGGISGFGVGICYNVILATVIGHFPDRVGLASGLMLMSFGLGSLILGSVATSLIVSFGWRVAFLALALGFALVVLLGSFIVTAPAAETSKKSSTGAAPLDMVRRLEYLKFFFWCTLMNSAGLLILGHAATCALDLNATLRMAGLSAGIISIFNGASRLMYGQIYDRSGFRTLAFVAGALYFMATLGMAFAYLTGRLWLLFIAFGILGLAYGAGPIGASTYVKERFGMRYYGVNLGITNLNIVIASFAGPFLAGLLRARFASYMPAFGLMLIFIAASFLLALGLQGRRS